MKLTQILKTWRVFGGNLLTEIYGGLSLNGPLQFQGITVVYSAAMTLDVSQGDVFVITVTNGVAFTINIPANSAGIILGDAQRLVIRIVNTSGGAAGAATFTAGAGGFRLGAAWAQPATGFSRSIEFLWNGTNWIESFRSAADVAN